MRTALLAVLIAAAAPASAQSEYVHVADPQVLVGKYHFEEKEGLTVDVSLNADGTVT